MHRGTHVLLLVALALLALAAPATTHALDKRSFKVPTNGRGKLDPLRELSRSSRKYGMRQIWQVWALSDPSNSSGAQSASESEPLTGLSVSTLATIPPTSEPTTLVASTATASSPSTVGNASAAQISASPASEDGEVTATPEEDDIEYLAPVTIGGQSLNLNFDTGSADLLVFSTAMPRYEIGHHAAFDPSKSPSWQVYPGASFNISYGDDSSASGSVGFDTVDVGGSMVQRQCVEIASQMSEMFIMDENSDGILGLSFSIANTVEPEPQASFFENVMHDLTEPLFTADLKEENGRGEYEFGTIDSTKYTGDIHYTPVDSTEGFWMIENPSYAIGGQRYTCNGCRSIVDTGTTLLLVTPALAQAYYNAVNGSQYAYDMQAYVYPCSANLPDFAIAVGGYMATIKGIDLTYTGYNGSCVGGLQAIQSGPMILGDVFLKQFFAIFDGGNLQFGIAEKM